MTRRIMGVYAIVHSETNKRYIGSSSDILMRWRQHRHKLNAGKHGNTHLQRGWNKYGYDAFEWLLLEEVHDRSQLIPSEQKWIDHYQSSHRNYGFNIREVAGVVGGMPEETKQRISHYHQLHLRGNTLTETEAREIIARCIAGDPYPHIAKDFHVSEPTIKAIAYRKNWKRIKLSPEEERQLAKQRGTPQGSKNGHASLTEADVMTILERCANGEYNPTIAKDFNITESAVRAIANRENWKSVNISKELEMQLKTVVRPAYKGEQLPQASLTTATVREIKIRSANGESRKVLAAEYGVSIATIKAIRSGRNWAHVTIN